MIWKKLEIIQAEVEGKSIRLSVLLDGIVHSGMVNALREWRDKTATSMDIPPIDVLDLPDGSL